MNWETICQHLDLGIPPSETVRNKCLLFVSHQSVVFSNSSQNGLRQGLPTHEVEAIKYFNSLQHSFLNVPLSPYYMQNTLQSFCV